MSFFINSIKHEKTNLVSLNKSAMIPNYVSFSIVIAGLLAPEKTQINKEALKTILESAVESVIRSADQSTNTTNISFITSHAVQMLKAPNHMRKVTTKHTLFQYKPPSFILVVSWWLDLD